MSTPNLIAYIPTLNQRHLDWLRRHGASDLFLIDQTVAEWLLPRLARNMAALPAGIMRQFIESQDLVRRVWIFGPQWNDPDLSSSVWKNWILPDEDISHLIAERYLLPAGCEVEYEMIWARWDMTAVHREQPVIHDVEISTDAADLGFIREAVEFAKRSPDWWRNVGAVVATADGKKLAVACNTHMPNEYETYIFGDPSLNRDAGQSGKSCAIHAEQSVITFCARHGHALEDARIYVSTFPCEGCAREIVSSGIRTVYFSEGYSSLNAQEVLRLGRVRVVRVIKDSGLA